jgi:hypothetical protein
MEVFWRLVLSHLIADFVLQTNWINKMKRKSIKGLIVHVIIHFVVTYLILMPYLGSIWFEFGGFKLNGYFMVFLICLVHLMVDEMRIYIINHRIYDDNTVSFLIDQFLHFYFIFMFTPFKDILPSFRGEKIVMILTFLVMIAHTTTIFIYYIEKDLKGLPFPSFDQKYFMIFERIVIWAFFLMNGWGWLFFLILWIIQLYYLKNKRIIDITNLNFALSIFISLVFGVLTRYYYYL